MNANGNTAEKATETADQRLARVLAENEALKKAKASIDAPPCPINPLC